MAEGPPLHLVSPRLGDAPIDGEVARLRAEISARDRQETAIGELGQAALTGIDPYLLLGQACALVEMTLGVSQVRALELGSGGRMVARASIGANETFGACGRHVEDDREVGTFVLLDSPVTFTTEDETRFNAEHLRRVHGVVGGAGVTIRTQHDPFGVLLVYSSAERQFHDYELAFLRATANILGEAVTRSRTEKKLEYHSHYDVVTGLPNRLLFRDRVVNALLLAKRSQHGLAVMYLDLDHFKLVNDGLGHSFGDILLARVAKRLQGVLRSSDSVSRSGGDEFSILISDVTDGDAIAGVARKILDGLSQPFDVEGHTFYLSASIGVSFYPSDGDDVETLLKCADAALYRAKELGRNQAQLFTQSMNERYVRRLALEQSLHQALEREELEVHYQPVYDRTARRVVSLEALVRWNDPLRGAVPASELIALAEETGLIIPLGTWVLRRACAHLRGWHAAGLSDLRMAVNISAHQLQQPDFPALVRDAIVANRIPPSLLQLEITETAAMQNVERTMRALREVKAMGVEIAIDDFGTGMSSLIYLRQFPIDTIKIDKEFLRDVTEDDTAAAIVSHVIDLAHTLRLTVVAEGVETEEQYAFLRHHNCDLLQGYLLSRPLPPEEIEPLITRGPLRPKTVEIPRPGE